VYLYVYDEFIQDKRFEKDLLQIENRLTDLGIAGKIARLALFRDPQAMIRDEIRRGASSVVAVGDDKTVRKILDTVAEGGATLGMIPLGEPGVLAKLFGIPAGVAACDILSARIVETVDVGSANSARFLMNFSIAEFSGELSCGKNCKMHPVNPGLLDIVNLGSGVKGVPNRASSDPTDGLLDVLLRVTVKGNWGFLKRTKTGVTHLPTGKIFITSPASMTALIDGAPVEAEQFEVMVEKGAIRVVMGRERLF
jgi:diacylglycerol kinase family enzyme